MVINHQQDLWDPDHPPSASPIKLSGAIRCDPERSRYPILPIKTGELNSYEKSFPTMIMISGSFSYLVGAI